MANRQNRELNLVAPPPIKKRPSSFISSAFKKAAVFTAIVTCTGLTIHTLFELATAQEKEAKTKQIIPAAYESNKNMLMHERAPSK